MASTRPTRYGTARVLIAVCLFSALCGTAAHAQSLGKDVNDAIKASIAYLKNQQKEDGTFQSNNLERYHDGVAALGLLALVKSRVPQDDQAVVRSLSYLRYKLHERTYSTGVRILALDAMDNDDNRPAIHAAAKWLVEHFRPDVNKWAYPDGGPDLSNTQYATLGLWTAERNGFEAPHELWIALAGAVMKHQNADGGFSYHATGESTGSMTTAGLAVLSICRERMSSYELRNSEVDTAIGRGWEFMEKCFHPEGNPVGLHAYSRSHYFYYLYGLERACAFGDRKTLGGRDWYTECASYLVRTQRDDGGWGSFETTCFALLFLRLSTFTSIGRDKPAAQGGDGAAGEREVRPENRIPFIRRWLLLGPFEDRDGSGLKQDMIDESRIDPKAGRRAASRTWTEYRSAGSRICMDEALGEHDRFVVYAFTRLQVLEDTEALLWIGSDDGARVRLDGELVHEDYFRESGGIDRHCVPVMLTRGTHRLLVKVSDFTRRCCFWVRLTAPDGKRLEGCIPFVQADGPSTDEIIEWDAPFAGVSRIFREIRTDRKGKLGFDSRKDLERVLIVDTHPNDHAFWMAGPNPPRNRRPQAGARGMVFLHPLESSIPARLYRKVRVPSSRARLQARVAAVHPDIRPHADWIARLGIFTGFGEVEWVLEEIISAGRPDNPAGWFTLSADLGDHAREDVLVILECSTGGPDSDWMNEYVFIDEFSVVTR